MHSHPTPCFDSNPSGIRFHSHPTQYFDSIPTGKRVMKDGVKNDFDSLPLLSRGVHQVRPVGSLGER